MGLNNPGGCKGAVKPKCPIINGGFETGDFTGWTTYAGTGAGTVTVESGDAAEGNHYARLQQPWSDYWYKIEQTIYCDPAGLNIHFQYRTAPQSGGSSNYSLQVTGRYSYMLWFPAGQTTWTTYDEPFQMWSPSPTQPLNLNFTTYTRLAYGVPGGPVLFDIDDVYLYQP